MIYADYAATTPCLPEAAAAVAEALAAPPGNPSARQHPGGRAALARLDQARAEVAALAGVRPDAVIFTASATEAANLAIAGLMDRLAAHRPGLLVGATEHPAVRLPAERAAGQALEVLPVDAQGLLTGWAERLHPGVGLLAVQAVNHETGVLQDLPALTTAARAAGALVLCDASQAPARMSLAGLSADLLILSSHKLYGPPGAAALVIRPGLGLTPLLLGGGQERGFRPGTPAVPTIAGFGVAARVALNRHADRHAWLSHLTARLETQLTQALPAVVIHGRSVPRAPGFTCLTHPGLRTGWLSQLAQVAASAGSACASGTTTPSPVLTAMGVPPDEARNALRISLGEATTEADVDIIATEVIRGARRLGAS